MIIDHWEKNGTGNPEFAFDIKINLDREETTANISLIQGVIFYLQPGKHNVVFENGTNIHITVLADLPLENTTGTLSMNSGRSR